MIKVVRNDSGAALMMAIFTVTMIAVIASEISYETSVEFNVSAQAINQVKAHYAAKAGVDIALLRIHLYRKAMAAVGQSLPSTSMLDMIWQMPFNWPPAVPKETSVADKDQINKAVKASVMQGQYFVTIDSESSKIDLNDLASPSDKLREATKQQILQIFKNKIEGDEAFGRKHSGEDWEKLVCNIADWIDEGPSQNCGAGLAQGGSGQENTLYTDLGGGEFYPPNTGFKTLQELHMVAGITDEYFEILAPRVTVYGSKAINVKYANKETLMSLAPQITAEVATKILEERDKKDTTAFKDTKSFFEFLKGQLNIDTAVFYDETKKEWKIPITLDDERNFRIKSTGRSGKVQRDITAIVFDFDRAVARLKELRPPPTPVPDNPANPKTEEQKKKEQDEAEKAKKKKETDGKKVPNTKPNIVYWNEI